MTVVRMQRLAGAFALFTLALAAPAIAGETASLEMDMPIEKAAVLNVSVDDGTVEITGADIDHVSIRAVIEVDDRLSRTSPMKAGGIANAVKRSPPISADGDRITITSLEKRTHQRYVTMAYEITVPHDATVTVHSDSGNVTVSGVTGPVEATSDSGEVTVAALD